MNESVTKKDLKKNNEKLFEFMTDKFGEIHVLIEDRNSEINRIETYGRRLDTVESRTQILKDVMESNLHTKVAW